MQSMKVEEVTQYTPYIRCLFRAHHVCELVCPLSLGQTRGFDKVLFCDSRFVSRYKLLGWSPTEGKGEGGGSGGSGRG